MPQPTGSQSDAAERLDGSNESSSGFPGGSDGKDPPEQGRRRGFDPWVGKRPWRRNWQPLQYACLGNPWTEEPGGLQSTGSQRVRHDLANQCIFPS